MSHRTVSARLRQLFGETAVRSTPDAPPRVTPDSIETCAAVLRTASEEGWRVAIAGAGTWQPSTPPVDVLVGTTALQTLGPVDAADLVATAQAGLSWGQLRRGLAEHGVWLAHDLPGGDRTLGSALATGSSGPLRAGFGPLRDHVLGMTVVTGDGRVVRVGGRVVKNVAGYDIGKLALGSFGAFGVVAAVHLRVRTVPRADETLRVTGVRDRLLSSSLRILELGISPAALELLSPRAAVTDEWTLAVRLVGTDAEVQADRDAVQDVLEARAVIDRGLEAQHWWHRTLAMVTDGPVTLRIGADPTGLDRVLDLLALHLDEATAEWTAVTVPAGTIRWSGLATAVDLARFRRAAAQLEWPVTIERAPIAILGTLGHFGAYREGVFRLVHGLRAVFDPAGILVTPLDTAA